MTGEHYSPHYVRDLGYSSPANRREETGMKIVTLGGGRVGSAMARDLGAEYRPHGEILPQGKRDERSVSSISSRC